MTPNPDASAPSGSEPPVDFEQLRTSAGEDADLIRELSALYFQQADEIMPSLQDAVIKGAAPEVTYFAHKLVGASLACGINGIVPPLRELEGRGRNGDLAGAGEFMAQVVSQMEVARAAIRQFLTTLT